MPKSPEEEFEDVEQDPKPERYDAIKSSLQKIVDLKLLNDKELEYCLSELERELQYLFNKIEKGGEDVESAREKYNKGTNAIYYAKRNSAYIEGARKGMYNGERFKTAFNEAYSDSEI
ncbi:MAG: hypothetical protein AAB482_01655 [Patescibacteria group bacterium]